MNGSATAASDGLTGCSVLVTGGAGFIGASLANELATRNEVIAVDDGSLGIPENLDAGVEFVEASVLDDLPTAVDVVFHLAALSSYPMHEESPTRGVRVNVEGFVNTVEQARKDGCETVVYASTSSVYGSRTDPSPETMSVSASTGYEASKLARERYAEYFSTHHGLSMAGMRLFSVYGGFDSTEGHKGEYANVITQFADAIASGERPVIYGDGSQTRDFTHISDVVGGLEAAAVAELDGVYNLGTGQRHSFETVVERLSERLGTEVDPEYVENPIPEEIYVHDTCADSTKLRSETRWEPTVSLTEGIERVCRPYLGSENA